MQQKKNDSKQNKSKQLIINIIKTKKKDKMDSNDKIKVWQKNKRDKNRRRRKELIESQPQL